MNIRNRILIFSLLITLIPSFGMGWLLNQMMQTTITEKSEQKLRHTSNIIQREIELWFKERNYDLYVFSNSFVITENYGRYLEARQNSLPINNDKPFFIRMLDTYLNSVQQQFDDYKRLFILDTKGTVVASSDPSASALPSPLPENFSEQIGSSKYIKGRVYFDYADGTPLILLGIPLFSELYENHAGILAIEVRLKGILEILKTAIAGIPWETQIYGAIMRLEDGRHFLTTEEKSAAQQSGVFSPEETLLLFDDKTGLKDYVDYRGVRVVGILSAIPNLGWGIVVSENYDDVFARVIVTRNRNIMAVGVLGLVIGLLAYLLARQIIRPLTTLTQGAQRVADGDLDVTLPVMRNDELGLATQVFNEMVAELKQNHAKLEQLATIDALTGLANRKEIMAILLNCYEHFQRYRTTFSILMIDVDHFKDINDTYGHQAGDHVLAKIGKIFTRILRNVDAAGRYGGEEFLIICTESDESDAHHVADRIRHAVENYEIVYQEERIRLTVSVGVATIASGDDHEDSLVKRADDALYQAKRKGRNRCVYLPGAEIDNDKKKKIINLQCSAEK